MKRPLQRHDDIERLVNHEQMRLILAIVEARSFSGAATALGVSQPSISQQVKRLEQAAGRTLFRRRSAGVELTSDGDAVVVYARAMLGLTDDLRRHLRESGGAVRIAVGMSEDFSRTALPAVLWLFMREHPSVEIRVISGPYDLITGALANHAVDLAVMRRSPLASVATRLWTDALVWKGRADLPKPILDPIPLVLPTAPNPARDLLFDTLRRHRRTWRVTFESSSMACVETALAAGLGVCSGPRHMPLRGVTQLDEGSGLPPLPDVEFVMVEPSSAASAPVLAFAEVLRAAARESYRSPTPVATESEWRAE